MRDAPPRAASFVVLGGPLGGARVLLDQAVDEALVGSDSGCRLCLDLPGVSPIHARLWKDADGLGVQDTHSPRGVWVNDDRVVERTAVRAGDVIWLGPPGDALSVMLQCRAAPRVETAAGAGAAPVAAYAQAGSPVAVAAEVPAEEVFFVDDVPAAAGPADAAESFALPLGDSAAPAIDDPVEFFVDDAPVPSVSPDTGGPVAGPGPFAEPAVAPAPPPAHPSAVAPVAPAQPPRTPAPRSAPAPSPLSPAADQDDVFVVQDEPAPPSARPRPVAPPAAAPTAATPPRAEVRTAAPRPGGPRPAVGPARSSGPRTTAAPGLQRPQRAAGPRTSGVGVSSRYVLFAAGTLVLAAGGFLGWRMVGGPRLRAASPDRVGNGLTIVLEGAGFSATPGENTVRFAELAGRVVRASADRLEVELPELNVPPSGDLKVPVVVEVGGRASSPLEIAVHQTPRIHGISPSVAMPGEEVLLAGAGWSLGATVRFGDLEALVLDTTTDAIRVRVPDIAGPPGTSVDVVVSIAGQASSPAPFMVGRLPLVTGVEPAAAAPGDVVKVKGRGFHVAAGHNAVNLGPAAALVVSAADSELEVAVPWTAPAGQVALTVRIPGSPHVGEASLSVAAPPDPAEFRFAAEPFAVEDAGGHDHAVLATAVGPAFVLSASGGQTAARRALEAQRRLNEAAVLLRASREADLEVRGLGSDPVVALAGRADALLSVSAEDAAAYDEDWTRRGGRRGPVTRDGLATWWTAVGRDLVLLLVRSEKPRHAASLGAEGRVLADVFLAARRVSPYGVPREVAARPSHRDGLRSVAYRVPASVAASGAAPAAPPPAAAVTAAVSAPARPAGDLKLDGVWVGTEQEGGRRKYVTMRFRGDAGSYSLDGAVSVTTPFFAVERPQRNTVRLVLEIGGGLRYYIGRWDGSRIAGKVSDDPSGAGEVATFEVSPKR